MSRHQSALEAAKAGGAPSVDYESVKRAPPAAVPGLGRLNSVAHRLQRRELQSSTWRQLGNSSAGFCFDRCGHYHMHACIGFINTSDSWRRCDIASFELRRSLSADAGLDELLADTGRIQRAREEAAQRHSELYRPVPKREAPKGPGGYMSGQTACASMCISEDTSRI